MPLKEASEAAATPGDSNVPLENPILSARGHLSSLDGLRAIAILLVLLFRLTPGREPNDGLRTIFMKVAEMGWSGVDLFFVLSGFLITTKLIQLRDVPDPFFTFYRRRMARILPLYYAVLTFVFLLFPLLSRSMPIPPLSQQYVHWLYLSDFVMTPGPIGYFDLSHFWSLSVEEQFYFLWPLVVLRMKITNSRTFCALLLLLPVIARAATEVLGFHWFYAYCPAPSRADGILLGSLIALIYATGGINRTRKYVPIALLVLGTTLAWIGWRGYAALISVDGSVPGASAARTFLPLLFSLFFAAVLVAALEWKSVGRLLSFPFSRFVARYSYGIYIFHWLLYPVFIILIPPETLRSWTGSANAAALVFFVLTATISFLLAAVSYELFERRFLPKRKTHLEAAWRH